MLLCPPKRAVVIACMGALLACSGRPAFDGSTYRNGKIAFRAGPVGEGWRPLEIEHAAVAFRDDTHLASVMVHARCDLPSDDAPLLALTNHLLIGTTERDVASEDTVSFDGREARHTIVTAKLDGVRQTFDLWVMKKDGCVYDLVYVAAPQSYAAGAPAFDRFARGFHTLSGTAP